LRGVAVIRAALRDLFPSRSTVGALRVRIAELEHENKALGEAYARVSSYNANINAECERLEREIADLQKRALRPNPTPGEARMLEIVRANPGLESPKLGMLALAVEHPSMTMETHGSVYLAYANGESKFLSTLHRKSLVRREKSGNTYRYWVNE
jgi:hypothetical protein